MIARVVAVALLCMLAAPAAGRQAQAPSDYEATLRQERERRVDRLRNGDFSPLKKVASHSLDSGRVTIGSAPESHIRLDDPGVAARHAIIEGLPDRPVLKALEGRVAWTWNNEERSEWDLLKPEYGLRIGRFGVLYFDNAAYGTRVLNVFDPEAPAMKAFRGLEFFPIDPKYRVSAEVIVSAQPRRIQLLDSNGRQQPWWIYGAVRFALEGKTYSLELYTETLDAATVAKNGFMVMFTDQTSEKESYPSTRYIQIAGRTTGTLTIDFNRATTPPCDFSPLYSCPFPRPQNRLPIPIPAGEKWYGKTKPKS